MSLSGNRGYSVKKKKLKRGIFMCDYGKEIFSGLKDGFKVVGRGDDVWKEMN